MQKPKCKLIGQNGNIYNLMAIAARTLKDNNMNQQALEMQNKVLHSPSYYEALSIIKEYVEVI